MGDARRFDCMADLIAARFPRRELAIADVAGGKGLLRAALHRRGYRGVTSWDKRHRNARGRPGYRYSLFHHDKVAERYDLVLGMHPDGGTDHIIRYAAARRVPFVVCPCCVIPSAAPYSGPRDYRPWLDHLERLATAGGHRVTRSILPMRGCNVVLIGHPA